VFYKLEDLIAREGVDEHIPMAHMEDTTARIERPLQETDLSQPFRLTG